MQEREIESSWVIDTIENSSLKILVSSSEIHFFKKIVSMEERCLKVVLNPKTMNVVTVYFDRKMRKKGCK